MARLRSKGLPASVLEQTNLVNELALSASTSRTATSKRKRDDEQNVEGGAKKQKISKGAKENPGLEKQSNQTMRHGPSRNVVAVQGESIFDVPDDNAKPVEQVMSASRSKEKQPKKTIRKPGRPRKETRKEETEEDDHDDDDHHDYDGEEDENEDEEEEDEGGDEDEEYDDEYEEEEKSKRRQMEEDQKEKEKEKAKGRPQISSPVRQKEKSHSSQQARSSRQAQSSRQVQSSRHARPSIPDDTESSDRTTPEADPADEQVQDTNIPEWALLGTDQHWLRVLEETAKNRTEEDFLKPKPEDKCEAKDVDELCEYIRNAIEIYSDLADGAIRLTGKVEKGLTSVAEKLKARVARIQRLDQPEATVKRDNKKPRRAIEGLYSWAIPGLVYLLKQCMYCWSTLNDRYDLAGLADVVTIMDITISACQIASYWSVKPAAGIFIVKNIRSRAFPALKAMKKTFQVELKYLEREEKKARNREKAVADQRARERAQPDPTSTHDVWQSSWRNIQNNIDEARDRRMQKLSHRLLDTRQELAKPTTQGKQSTSWTREESRELIFRLKDERTRYLPAKERYLEILNCPLLQNKLPEHIRDEALSLKPYLMEDHPGTDYFESIL